MKMTNETFNHILTIFKKHEKEIKEYAPILKANGKYNSFETRLSFDCFYKVARFKDYRKKTDELIKRDGLKDVHIETGVKKALRKLNVI